MALQSPTNQHQVSKRYLTERKIQTDSQRAPLLFLASRSSL